MTKLMCALVVMLFWANTAHAYIDPASGSAIMSAIIGFFVAVSLAVKTYWFKLKSLFTRRTVSREDTSQDQNTSATQKTESAQSSQ